MKTCLLHIDPQYKSLDPNLKETENLKLLSWSSMGNLGRSKWKLLNSDLIVCSPYYNTPQLVGDTPQRVSVDGTRTNLLSTIQILRELLHYNKTMLFFIPTHWYHQIVRGLRTPQPKPQLLDPPDILQLHVYGNPALFQICTFEGAKEDLERLYPQHNKELVRSIVARVQRSVLFEPSDMLYPYSATIGLIRTVLAGNKDCNEQFRVEENLIHLGGIAGETKRLERLFRIHYRPRKYPRYVLRRIDTSWGLLCKRGRGPEHGLLLYKKVDKAIVLTMPLCGILQPKTLKLISLIVREARSVIASYEGKDGEDTSPKQERKPQVPSGDIVKDGLKGEAKALVLLLEHPDWTNKEIAKHVPCHEKTLYRWEKFKTAREALKAGKDSIPGGKKYKEGYLEAWDNNSK